MQLVTQKATVRFGATTALDGVSVALPSGSQVALHGPSSSGKTCLLKVLAGLQRCTSGEVRWDDADVATLPVAERRAAQSAFGMVFQTDALFDSMSTLQNVRVPLLRRGVAADEATQRAMAALEQVGLGAAAQKSPEHLSGGMKKRAGIARAIVARPTVLFADDPFAGLDPDTEAQIAALLLLVSKGRTLLVALPDPIASLPLPTTWRLTDGRLST